MAIDLNHTIVHARDRETTARHLVEVLGLEEPARYGPFLVVQLANGVSLDVMEDPAPHPQHYAFLVGEDEFDEIFGRLQERGIPYWADPFHQHPDAINHGDGGRGVYWDDPDGHSLEIITRPYGSGA